MYIALNKLSKAWEFIKEDAHKDGGCTVLILVAPDADAIAACRIVTSLLRSEFILYKVKPVYSYEHLHEIRGNLITENESLKSLILINCGGTVDLGTFLELPEDGLTVYVVDCHRPHNIRNIQDDTGRILLLGDEEDVATPVPDLDDYSESSESEYESDEGYEDDLALEDGMEDGTAIATRKRKRKTKIPGLVPRKRHRVFYKGAYYGPASSTLMYLLAFQLAKSSNDLLWYAILGLTDQYIHNRIDQKVYFTEVDKYQREVKDLNSTGEEEEEDLLDAPIRKLAEGSIVVQEEYKFPLYRHWNLLDAMSNSQYVATKMTIWKSDGDRKLLTLFAKMGIPLDQCKQTFTSMRKEFKDVLHAKIFQYAEEFGLPEISYLSFVRRTSANLQLSAADAVHAITTLSEIADIVTHPHFRTMSEDGEGGKLAPVYGSLFDKGGLSSQLSGFRGSGENSAAGATTTGGEGSTARALSARDKWEEDFWIAFDACSPGSRNHATLMLEGIHLSILVQKAIVRQATELIKKKVIIRSGPFRYCYLTHREANSIHDLSLFQHPVVLTKLANFIMEKHEQEVSSKKRSRKPFLIAAQNESKDKYLVVGVSAAGSSKRKNTFGNYFQEAVEKTGAEIVVHMFDRSVVEVRADQISRFIGYMHLHMSSAM